MPKVAPLDDMVRILARNRADKVRQAFADNPSNRYSVMKQMEDDLIGELTPMLTRTWKPSMRRGPRGLQDIMQGGKFDNIFLTKRSAGAYDPERRRALSEDYFYDIGPAADHGKFSYLHVSNAEREKYGYLKRPKKLHDEDDVDFYGEYDIRFKPSVRKHMTVTNGDSFDNWRSGHIFHGTPIVPSDPETYINWVAAPENFDTNFDGNPNWADEEMFGKVFNDLKTYQRPTFRFRNAPYIEAQYHGPLTVDDIQSIGSSPYVEPWLREESMKHGIPILDRETGKCIYNCR